MKYLTIIVVNNMFVRFFYWHDENENNHENKNKINYLNIDFIETLSTCAFHAKKGLFKSIDFIF